jgi:hypothetical protein
MSVIKYFLYAFLLIASFLLLQGCCNQALKITAVHTYGQVYTISIGDTSGGGGVTLPMILIKPDCTDTHWPPEVIELSVGDTTGGGGRE